MVNEFLKITNSSYDKIAKNYVIKRDNHFFWGLVSKFICRKFLSQLPKQKKCKVLVVGSAGGHDTLYMAKKSKHYFLGIDFSRELVKIAKQKKEKQKIPNCDFRLENIINAKLTDKFDGIFCDGVLYHIPRKNLPQVLDKFYKALKPKSYLYANFKKGKGHELQENPVSYAGEPRAYWFYTKKQLQSIFDKAGFKAKIKAPIIRPMGESYIEVYARPKRKKPN
ncbi:class I SAM-dependent methyltransferase [Candidatus Woesearchaeota archaeon]|nr:class I SAM-dependent methyltransferase [Candidatus Woesearchaeota archaeon]